MLVGLYVCPHIARWHQPNVVPQFGELDAVDPQARLFDVRRCIANHPTSTSFGPGIGKSLPIRRKNDPDAVSGPPGLIVHSPSDTAEPWTSAR
jgi:hypothetical protein